MDAIRYVLDFQWAAGWSGWQVRALFAAFFALVLAFALAQRTDYVFLDAPDRARWRDLRLWAVAILALQAVLYLSL